MARVADRWVLKPGEIKRVRRLTTEEFLSDMFGLKSARPKLITLRQKNGKRPGLRLRGL